jgi:hypothetical protein
MGFGGVDSWCELELELALTQMTQKPVLRAEGEWECACVAPCENQGVWVPKSLQALVGGAHSGNAKRKAPDLRKTKFHYIRGQERPFDAQSALCSAPGQRPRQGKSSSLSLIAAVKREGHKNRNHIRYPLLSPILVSYLFQPSKTISNLVQRNSSLGRVKF